MLLKWPELICTNQFRPIIKSVWPILIYLNQKRPIINSCLLMKKERLEKKKCPKCDQMVAQSERSLRRHKAKHKEKMTAEEKAREIEIKVAKRKENLKAAYEKWKKTQEKKAICHATIQNSEKKATLCDATKQSEPLPKISDEHFLFELNFGPPMAMALDKTRVSFKPLDYSSPIHFT